MTNDLEEMIGYYNPVIDEEKTAQKVKKFWRVLFPELLDTACITITEFQNLGTERQRQRLDASVRSGKSLKALNALIEVRNAVDDKDQYCILSNRFVNAQTIDSYCEQYEMSKKRYYVLEQRVLKDFANQLQYTEYCPHDLVVMQNQKDTKKTP